MSSLKKNTAPASGPIYKVGDGVYAPVVVYRLEPDLKSCKPPHVTSMVLVSAVIDKHGRVRDAHILKPGDRCFDRISLEALKQWRFKPAMKDGKPVSAELVMTNLIHFK